MATDSAESWMMEGDALFQEKKYEAALDCYLNATDIDPDYAAAWHQMGLICQILGQPEEAAICFSREEEAILKVNRERVQHISSGTAKPPIPVVPVSPFAEAQERSFCHLCGSELPSGDLETCPHCGMRLSEPPKEPIRAEKNPLIAALCSFIIPGLGQIYNGDARKAIALLFGTVAGLLFLVIPGLIVWIYGIYDAHKTAGRMNSGEIPGKSTTAVAMILFGVPGFILVTAVIVIEAAIIAAFVFGITGIFPAT
jgi:TM2 domain-containing membrane protein YozV